MEVLIEKYQLLLDNWEIVVGVVGALIACLFFNWLEHGNALISETEVRERNRDFFNY